MECGEIYHSLAVILWLLWNFVRAVTESLYVLRGMRSVCLFCRECERQTACITVEE